MEDARWALDQRPGESESPIGKYAAVLALLVLAEDEEAARTAQELAGMEFPEPVAAALQGIATHDRDAYGEAVKQVLESFETREDYLEDIPVADTVVVLEALAARRVLGAGLRSSLLPEV